MVHTERERGRERWATEHTQRETYTYTDKHRDTERPRQHRLHSTHTQMCNRSDLGTVGRRMRKISRRREGKRRQLGSRITQYIVYR